MSGFSSLTAAEREQVRDAYKRTAVDGYAVLFACVGQIIADRQRSAEVVRVRCPHREGLAYRDGKMLSLLPCDCNDPSEVLEVVSR